MISLLPALFSAYAVRAEGDRDLPDGVHLRLLPSPMSGLPLSPFLVWQVRAQTRPDKRLSGPNFAPNVAAGYVVAAEVVDPGPGARIALLDQSGQRIIAARSKVPLIVAAPRIGRVKVEGVASELRYYVAGIDIAERSIFSERPLASLALPVAPHLPWYAGGIGSAGGIERVRQGAPRRFGPNDRPEPSSDALVAADETERLAGQLGDLDRQLSSLLGDAAMRPCDVAVDYSGVDAAGMFYSAASSIESELVLRALDPGVARYLGLAGLIGDAGRPLPIARTPLPIFATVALFALDNAQMSQLSKEAGFVLQGGPDDPAVQRMIELVPGLADVVKHALAAGFWVSALGAFSAAPMPADPPVIPAVLSEHARWIGAGPAGEFQQEFAIVNPPLAPLLAVARQEGAGWVSQHEIERLAAGSRLTERRLVRLLGKRTSAHAPVRHEPSGYVSESPIPGGAPKRYRFWLGDIHGRYGPPYEADTVPPPRSAPPEPEPQVTIEHAPTASGTSAAVSPGRVRLRVPVPGIDELALGALPIRSTELRLGDVLQTLPAVNPVIAVFALPALPPQGRGEAVLDVRFIDTVGTPSPASLQTIRFLDGRQPEPVPVGYGLIWTSCPGPAAEVELALNWPSPPGRSYRVYITDAAGLGLSGATRADVADQGVSQQRAGALAGDAFRRQFRLLLDRPITADAIGQARLRATLPRAMRTVQFVRIVPLTDNQVEAEFDACGIVPVGVPDDRRPPPPRLRILPGGGGHALTLRTEAQGLNLVALRAKEPGLFASPADPAALPPEYRLRRASGRLPDPVYARTIRSGPLLSAGTGAATLFAADISDDDSGADLQPFARYTYWCEVRMPAERRVLREEAPVADAVRGADDSQMEPAAGLWSEWSNPVTILNAPAQPPAAPGSGDVAARVTPGIGRQPVQAVVTLKNAPTPTGTAIWRLRVWRSWGDQPLSLVVPDMDITTAEATWTEIAPVGSRADFHIALAIVDPLGRQGGIMSPAVQAGSSHIPLRPF